MSLPARPKTVSSGRTSNVDLNMGNQAAFAGSLLSSDDAEPLVFDRAVALDRVEGDWELLREVIGIFLECCAPMLAEVWQASARGDMKATERAAHALKGSLASLAANEAWGLAAELEELAREAGRQGMPAAFKRLEQALERLRPSLQAVLESAAC
ncbi:MAG TPA: Hpt domain-containing protein [Terriglobia bacterium]